MVLLLTTGIVGFGIGIGFKISTVFTSLPNVPRSTPLSVGGRLLPMKTPHLTPSE